MLDEITQQVNLLTLPIQSNYWQDMGRDKGGRKLRTSYAPPLLDQLRDSAGGSGGAGRGGSEQRTRAAIDFDAVEQYAQIRLSIHNLLLGMTGVPEAPAGEIKDELRRWLRLYSQFAESPFMPHSQPRELMYHKNLLSGWVIAIQSKFDPPKKIELLFECPVESCGQRYFINAMGDRESSLVALIPGSGETRAMCRSCGMVWAGETEIVILGRKAV